jgi:glycosyltransferase 2 family protein
MKLDNKKIFETLNPNKVWVPVLIGLVIVFFMFYLDPNVNTKTLKGVFDASALGNLIAILVILGRDVGYVYRIREITDNI